MARILPKKIKSFAGKFFAKIKPKFSLHYVSYTVLVAIIIFSLYNITHAALYSTSTPNPGHPWTDLGYGAFQFTNDQTAFRTYTLPDASANILTDNALITVPQGGTGANTLSGILLGNGASAFTSLALTAGQSIRMNAGGTAYEAFTPGSGSVSSISIDSANGFVGSSSGGSTPILTISTSITGMLKGNGTAISAASAGIDYQAPLTFSTGLTNTAGTITANLSTGVSGNQTIIGSTTGNGTLTFEGNNTTGNNATNANLIFNVGDSGSTNAMTILNNGNVGIRTTAPGELLSLGLAGVTKGVFSLAGNTSGKIIIQPQAAAGTYTLTLPATAGISNQFLQTDGNGNLSWASVGNTQWGSSGSNIYYTSGNVGIGTNSPDAGLSVYGIPYTTTLDVLNVVGTVMNNGNGQDINLQAGSSNYSPSGVFTGGNIYLTPGLGYNSGNPVGGNIFLAVDNSNNPIGKVGIGTNTPAYTLDINGDVNIASGSHYKINGTNLSYSDVGAQVAGSYATGSGTASGTNTGDQTLTIAGTTSPTIALSGSNTATFSHGTGITLGQTGGTITITNSSPDQTVAFTGGTNVTIGGTYPNFSITDNSINSSVATLSSLASIGTITTGVWHGTALTSTYLPSTTVYNNQANTYSTGLQDFSSATMKLPSSVTVGANSITLPASAGTVALTSQITGTNSGTNTGDQTLTIAGTTSPTIALSGSNTATFSHGTGITLGQTGGTITITNSAPDQTVAFTGGTNVTIGGTYPNFSITDNSINSSVATLSSLVSIGTITTGVWHGTALTSTYLPSTTVYNNQANTYSTGLQDFSSATMKLPSSVTVGANSITLPASAGTVALTSQITGTNSGTNTGDQTLTIAGTTSPTIALSGSNTATFSHGTGITLGQTGGTITITNSSPDQTVAFTGGTNVTIGGTYPNFSITDNSINSSVATLSSLTSVGALTTGSIGTGFVVKGVTMTLSGDASYDMYYRNASGVLTRLANGTTGQVLTATTGAAPGWAAAGGSSSFSGLTAATGTNTIDNTNYAQTWNWSTANTQSPLTMNFNALTSGSALSLLTSNASLASTNGFLYVANTAAATGTTPFVRLQPNSTSGSGFTLTNAGNVGIGTASPQTKLHIENDLNTSAANWLLDLTNNNTEGNTPTAGILFDVGDNSNRKGGILFQRTASYGRGDMYFLNNNTADASDPTIAANTAMVIKAGGNVGIGTTGPTNSLDVRGTGVRVDGEFNESTTNTGVFLGRVVADNTPRILFANGNAAQNWQIDNNSGAFRWYLPGVTYMNLSTTGLSVPNGVLTVSGAGNTTIAGNVGIGTTIPGSPLEVAGLANTVTARFTGTNTGASWAGRIVAGGASNVFLMGQYNNHAWLGAHNAALSAWADFYIQPDGTAKTLIGRYSTMENTILTIDNATGNSYFMNGNVGIGTTSPNEALEVVGNIRNSALTASQLVASDANKNLVSLPVATYPSLTELSYEKGVTSAIQTQLNGKQASGSYQPLNTNLTSIGGLANAVGWLHNDGSGNFVYSSPTGGGDMILASVQTNSGAKTFLDGTMLLRNVANTFTGQFTNTNTANRTYTLKDASGTLAFTSDITGTNSGTNTGDQTLTIAGTTSPTIALSGSNTATFASSTGITLGQSGGTITITNSAPDKTVAFTGGTNVTIGGTYPNFTITDNSINSSVATLSSLASIGTITTGVWHGTAIADTYISSASTWNGKQAAYANLTTIGALANGSGALTNNGAGVFSYTTIPTVGTWGALNYPTWSSGTPFVKMTAAGTFALDTNTYLTSVGTGVANQLTYWSGTNTLGSLDTATYPSLTELSYVKGVTSAIQTQLNGTALLAGRSGGQILNGGIAQTEILSLKGNAATATGTNIAGGEVNLYATPGTGTGVSGFHFFTGTTLGTGSTLQTSSEKVTILGNGNVGIGTATPGSLLTVSASSTSTLAVTDGSANNVLTVDTNTATSNSGIDITAGSAQTSDLLDLYSSGGSVMAGFDKLGNLSFNSSNLGSGVAGPIITVGINSNATPGAGSINFENNAAGAGYVWQDHTGLLRINTSAPTNANDTSGTVVGSQSSSLSYKNVIGEFTDYQSALQAISDAPLYNFTYKSGAYNNEQFTGIITDYSPIFGMDPDPTHPSGKSLNVINGIGYSFAAIKELNLNMEGVAGTVTPIAGSTTETFVTAFFKNIENVISTWLADATNGIADIFAKQINTKTLCVSDDSGAKTCITKSQLDSLLSNAGSAFIPTTPSTSSGPTASPSATPDLTTSDTTTTPASTTDTTPNQSSTSSDDTGQATPTTSDTTTPSTTSLPDATSTSGVQ